MSKESYPLICIKTNNCSILSSFKFIDYYEMDEMYQVQQINIVPNIRVNKLKSHKYLGSNTNVGIIDSGIDRSLINVSKNIICSDSGNSDDSKPDGRLHGTIVAKVIKHIACWSNIVNLKVTDDDGVIWKRFVLKALDWAYSNNIKIVNMSLGRKSICGQDCMVCNVVNTMSDRGFIIVAAIGNYRKEGAGITGCPGNAKKAFTVGAVDANKKLADYSSTAPEGTEKPNILAPGYVSIKGGIPYTGTSFATPFITGTIAALAPNFDLRYARKTIEKTAVSIGLQLNEQGSGLIHIENLLGVLNNERRVDQNQG